MLIPGCVHELKVLPPVFQASGSSKFDPPPKMDPALERELALKQLNELPSLKKQRRRRCDPGPADHVLIRTNVGKPEQKPKRKVRKQRGEVDRGIQAGPGALASLKVSVKRKSPLILISPTTKKAKPEVKKTQALVNGTTQTSPAKTEGEPVLQHEAAAAQEAESSEADSPKKRKQHRELDMLLGDEGAVNMIYEAEHGQKQQVARLVKNAVLRLSSSGPLPSRPRGRRKSTPPTSPPSVTPSEPRSPPQTFNFPPKLAEQSRIIRRHSSDSEFSSRSNSPEPQIKEPLTIIPGPRKKKGVPIFVKKIERTYKGKKKLTTAGDKPAAKPAGCN
ncbi:hypothetical protein B566_EDAN013664 [Ephemera danica]|nr:hypothetical protein B566_EDAN013664 [Ephemera danica]